MVVVALLFIGLGACGLLYLMDTIKLGQAGIGAGCVAAVATILALLK